MLWYGSRLRAWVLEGGRPELNRAAAGRVRAFSFDSCARLQAGLPTPPLAGPPVIITGLWRTGTTLLHEMLAGVEGLVAPTTWQCLRPASFRLVPPGREAETVRPMDGLAVTTSSPQEDEFALLLRGAPSLYRGFLDPRRLPDLAGLLAGDDRSFLPDWLAFLGAVQAETPGRLLLKSPNHLFRLPAIRAAFPDAPIIITLRDPAETWWSNVRMWTEMAALHGHWPAPPDAVEAFVTAALKAAARRLDLLAQSPPPRLALCHFDHLVADPAQECLRLLDLLPEPCTDAARQTLAKTAAARAGHHPRGRAGSLPASAADAASDLAAAMARLAAVAG
jgi:hypothetical protein